MVKKIEDKYKSMSQIEHILHRPGMYIGSIKEEQKQMFLYDSDTNKMQMRDVSYTPGLLKLIDEVISNSCDEFRRPDNMGLTKINVEFTKDGHFIISDNGGIPVVKHKEAGLYVPEFIFGQLRTSSNYNDDEVRNVIGTNGIGCKIANIFSKKFSVETADGKNKFFRSWSNNMQMLNNDLSIDKCKDHYTRFEFDIDWSRFEDVDEITEDFKDIIIKRCIDAAAANKGLSVSITAFDATHNFIFNKFSDYIELYRDYVDIENMLEFSDTQKSVWVFPDGGLNIGFVDGAECSKGTHIKAVRNEINTYISEYIIKKHKLDVGARNIDNKYTLFCDFVIDNPSYDSQTKECLTTPVERFSKSTTEFDIPKSFLDACAKSEIVNITLDWYRQKMEVEDQKTIRKLNKQAKSKIKNPDKYIEANSKKSQDKQLWLFEGFSAAAGFRQGRDPQTQAAYMLRGKVLNVSGLTPTKIMSNQELSDIITILGLQWGQKNDCSKLNVGKIIIASDQDYDGFAISGLLFNFFNLFPELFDAGMVYRSSSPIIIARKGNQTKKYFKIEDYKKEETKLKGWAITYIKGLGSLEAIDFKEMLQHPILHKFSKDDLTDIQLRSWFAKDNAQERKSIMKDEVE